MRNGLKIASGAAAILIVGGVSVWLDARPVSAGLADYAQGSLGRAVAEHCNPRRSGTFEGEALKDAITCRDLAAQESMALSTASLVWLNWLQIAVSIAGAAAVLWTIMVSLRSMSITQKALEHQQIATRMELRPTFSPLPITAKDDGSGRLRVSVLFKNVGSSTAKRFRHDLRWKVVPHLNGVSLLDESKLRLRALSTDTPKDGTSGIHFTTSLRNAALIKAGTHCIQLAYIAVYDDDLGGRYKLTYCREVKGADLSEGRRLREFSFTEPELKNREP